MKNTTEQKAVSRREAFNNWVLLPGFAGVIILWMLPPIEPLTQCGMRVLGIFVGILYFCAFKQMIWPGILAVVAMSFLVPEVYPAATSLGIHRAIELSWGYWMIPFIAASLILAFALRECGFMRRIAIWILSRKAAQKGPWAFIFALLFSALMLGTVFDPLATTVFFIGFSSEIFERLDFHRGDGLPCTLCIGIGFAVMISYGMTPISHPLPMMALDIYQNLTGQSISFLSYMLFGVPLGLLCFGGLMLFLRCVVRPNTCKLQKIDFQAIIGTPVGKMEKRERLTVAVVLMVMVSWLLFGLLEAVIPASAITALCSRLTAVVPALVGVALLGMIRVDAAPLLDIEHALKNGVTWNILMLLSGLLLTGNALAQNTTGFPALLSSLLSPILGTGLSPYVIMGIIITAVILLINFFNNIPVVVLLLSACIPIAASLHISAVAVTVLIAFAGQMSFSSPSSFAVIAFLYGVDWIKPSSVFRYGMAMMTVCILIVAAIGLPFSIAMFH